MPARREYYEKDWVMYFKCTYCWEFKTVENFSKHKKCFMWITTCCKECEKKKHAEYYLENKEVVNKKNKDRREEKKEIRNKDKRERYANDLEYRSMILWRSKEWRENNKDKVKKHSKEYYENNKEKIAIKWKEYYEKNKEYINMKWKKYYEEHKEQHLKKSLDWKKNNRDKMNKYQQEYRNKRWKEQASAHRNVEKVVKALWIRPTVCPICWKESLIIAHHPTSPDYSQWNIIVWCCNECHIKIHKWIIDCPEPIDLLDPSTFNIRR